MKIWLVVIFSVLSIIARSQSLDSIHGLLDGLPNSEQKLPVLHTLWQVYSDQDSTDKAIYYADKEKELSQTLNNDLWLAKAYFSLGFLYRQQGYLGKAIEHYVYAKELFKILGDQKNLADVYYNLGNLFLVAEDYLNAKLYYTESLKYYQLQDDAEFLAWIYLNIGESNTGLGMYEEAIAKYEIALEKAVEAKDSYVINFLYNNIGTLYQNQQLYNLARDNFYKSIALDDLEEIDFAIAYNNIGETYLEENSIEQAQEFFEKSLAIKDLLNATSGKVVTYLNIGKSYVFDKDYKNAKIFLNMAIDLAQVDVIDRGAIEALNILNEIHNLEAKDGIYPTGQEMLKYENIQTKQLSMINNLNDELAPLKNRYLLQINYEVPMLNTQLSRAISSKNINSKLAVVAAILALVTIAFMAYYMRKVFMARKMLSKF